MVPQNGNFSVYRCSTTDSSKDWWWEEPAILTVRTEVTCTPNDVPLQIFSALIAGGSAGHVEIL